MAEISAQEFMNPAGEAAPKGQPAGEVSFDEFAGNKLPKGESDLLSNTLKYMKATGGEAAALTDLVLSMPGFVIGTGAQLGASAVGLAAGDKDAIKEGRRIGLSVSEYLGSPLQKLLDVFQQGDITKETATTYGMQKFTSLVEEAGDWVEKSTGGRVPKESVPMLVDTLMVGATGFAKPKPKIAEAGLENRPTYNTPESIVEAGPQRTAQQDIVDSLGIKTTQEREAFNKQRRADVRAAFKAEPDYADYLKYVADERTGYGKNYPNGELVPAASAAVEAKPNIKLKSTPEQIGPEPIQIGTPEAQAAQRAYDSLPGGTDTLGRIPSKEELAPAKEFPHEEFGLPPEELAAAVDRMKKNDERIYREELADPARLAESARVAGISLEEMRARVEKYLKDNKVNVAAAGGLAAYLAANPEDAKDIGLVGAAALAVKAKGGMWHPEAVDRLAMPLETQLVGHAHAGEVLPKETVSAGQTWARRSVRNYLNKYAGTKEDPLAPLEIPYGRGTVPWDRLWDKAIATGKVKDFVDTASGEVKPQYEAFKKAPPEETVFGLDQIPGAGKLRSDAIQNYLSHVGDYLRQKVPPEKLQQYDLVRAVKETKKWDDELAKAMEKQSSDLSKLMPVYKEYPDGFKWVEVRAKEGAGPPEGWKIKDLSETGGSGFAWVNADGKFAEHAGIGGASGRSAVVYNTRAEAAKSGNSMATRALLDQEGEMMGHCVGGYCDIVESGEGKIYSLRDAKGRSHVTIEVTPLSGKGEHATSGELPDISQIKGKQNRAPSAEYLPYVQDFVKSGKWGDIGDFQHTELEDMQAYNRPYRDAAEVKFPGQRYLTRKEIESVPIPQDQLDLYAKGRLRDRGNVDPKLLARMAAVGVGAVAGAYIDPDHPFKSAILGALTGAVVSHISPRGVVQAIQQASKPGKLLKIDELMNATQYARKAAGRALWQLQTQVEELVPSASRRGAISHRLEGDTSIQLSPKEQTAAAKVQQFFAAAGEAGMNSGTLRDLIDNYVTHIFGREHKGLVDEIMTKNMRPNMSPNTPFAQKRSGPPTIREINALAKQKGIAPITDDISTIVGIYGNSLSRAMENRKFIQALRATKDGEGNVLVSPTYKEGYQSIAHPQLRGQWVHPDIVPDLKMVFDANDPGVVMRSLEAINTTQKRMAVSFSMFHAKSLEDALLGADRLLKAPGRVIKSVAQAALPSVFGKNTFLKQLRTGGAGDIVDRSLKAGLEFSMERQGPALQELRQGFYESLKGAQKFLDSTIPGTGVLAKGFARANHAFDNFMWGRLHAGLKLEIFADKSAELQRNNAAAAEANPGKVKLKTQAEIDKIAASFSNDIFGGLNWQRLVQEAQTRWGRQVASSLLSPTGRSVTRLLLFAPDWTISTTRAAWKAFGKGSGVKGLLKPTELADLHRQYILRSAFWYAIIGDSINYSMSGHHLWENKDPTRIDVGDGRTMQWSKHTMEPVHWLTGPRQQALNKLAVIPKTAAELAFNKEYLSTGDAPKMKDNPAVHVAKKFSPIAVGQSFEGGAEAGMAGFMGAPIYGKTRAEREAIKERRKLERQFKGGMK